jgi:tRNA-dihydrouridine synthase B
MTDSSIKLGRVKLQGSVLAAPMAGVSDRPYRRLARIHGAALAVSEMISANPALRHSSESLRRIDHSGETGPISIQLLGADPLQMAEAAKFNVDRGANIIDINMGCPSKKVCNPGSAPPCYGMKFWWAKSWTLWFQQLMCQSH